MVGDLLKEKVSKRENQGGPSPPSFFPLVKAWNWLPLVMKSGCSLSYAEVALA